MKKFSILLWVIALPIFCSSQNRQQKSRERSLQSIAYRITAAEMEQFVKWDSIPVNSFIDRDPLVIFPADSVNVDKLPLGNYLLISTNNIYIAARTLCISNLVVLDINNKNRLQLDVRDKAGEFFPGANVFVNNQQAYYNNDSKTFRVNKIKKDEAFVKVYIPGDTLFMSLTVKDDNYAPSIPQQRRRNYRQTRIYRYLNWLPSKLSSLFHPGYNRLKPFGAKGYIIFNQPKYKPLDTVKFKGYVLDRHDKQYKNEVEVHLNYNNKGQNYDQLIRTLKPASPGAFAGQFILADTMPLDITCRLLFKTKSKKEIIKNQFKIEEYVLDEIGTYHFSSEKETYFKNDSLRFFASAKDANDLNVMDEKATLVLTTESINNYYQDTLFVKDTIYSKEVPLATMGDTKFAIPADQLPKANITIRASLGFKNSNNELHEEIKMVVYKYLSKEIVVTQQADTIRAVYLEDGIEKITAGEMGVNEDTEKIVSFPLAIKIDPIATDYSFYVNDEKGKSIVSQYFEVEEKYHLNFSRISSGDTLGFVLNNPYQIPVYFSVFNGNKMVAAGRYSDAQVTWRKVMSNQRQSYKVRWQYIWAGKEQQGEENIGLLYKLLNIQISGKAMVYPGQKDSINIDVKDYKGIAAENVNLTAVSYNNQFNKDIRVPEPPYLARYKSKNFLLQKGYENDDDNFYLSKQYPLGRNKPWISKLRLDTMVYYKLLFPKESYEDAATLINSIIPQVSINVVDKGVPQPIYLLYLNRELVYYNGVTDSMKYSFEVYPGNVLAGIRLKDRYIEIDSLYIQPNYKHEISIDVNKLPQHATVNKVEKYWSYAEMNRIEQSMWMMQNDYRNNNAYVWQGNNLVHLSGNRQHIAGPFREGNITFFNPGEFDISFKFEPGYQYSLSKQISRLEKKPLFLKRNEKNWLPEIANPALVWGDTLVPVPVINYPVIESNIYLKTNTNYDHNSYAPFKSGAGSLQFIKPKDSVIAYYILEPADTFNRRIIMPGNSDLKIKNIRPGMYSLLFVTYKYYTARVNNIMIQGGGTTCIKATATGFLKDDPLLQKIILENEIDQPPAPVITKKEPANVYIAPDNVIYIASGGAIVGGSITDKRGKSPVPGASVFLKGYNKGVMADASGNFIFNGLRPGKYILKIASVGYEAKEMEIVARSNENLKLEISLNASSQSLSEVVVTGYGTMKKKDLTGSIVMINGDDLSSQLQGRTAGLQFGFNSSPGNGNKFLIRGISAVGNDKPLYVIDGILSDEPPTGLDESNIGDMTILKNAAAMALYGARAANGAIIITTKNKTFRQHFKDYALWQPNFFTDQNGHAAIEINYPDNITGWKTFVVAMDKNTRMGKASILTQAYKPMVAELSVPQFLIDGDSINIIGKSKNYTADRYSITNEFVINGDTISRVEKQLLPNEASIESIKISNAHADTITASFTLQSNTGFSDGEERKIPVFKKGTEEALGNFWILQHDTTVSFTASPMMNGVNLYAQNNALDMMLEELEHLRSYPYYCMEQTASKMMGLALEKKIRTQLKQPFANKKEFDRLLQKIQKGQQFDGGWAWWENGKTNFYITNYITNSLQSSREEPLIETNIRNAFLYLQNQLPFLNTGELLAALFTLSNGRHEMNYAHWINRINYDSLTQHQQWQWVHIKQQQKMNYQPELKMLVDKGTATMLGGMHWGNQNYSWHSNEIATTVLAYKVLENEPAYSGLCSAIIQYFLEKRRNGYWNNTVESATILNTILPNILLDQKDFTQPAALSVTGDTFFQVKNFPYKLQIKNDKIKSLSISKTGGGMVYFTAYQQIFNAQPQPVADKFIIHSFFQKNNETIAGIKAGEKIKMIVSIQVLKDADYVQIEIPIPAGCNYASKINNDWRVYKEFYKDKVMLFTESLSKGMHQFEIDLEPRYAGNYTLNPAKVSLMYYPVFFGRNEMRKVDIRN